MENNALSPASQRYARPGTGSQPDYARTYAVLASMADAVYCVDPAGCFTFVNTAFEAMTGYALADLRGTPATRLYVPEIEALFTERRRQVYSGATVSPCVETVLLLKDGRQLPVELSVSNLIIEGQIAGRMAVLRDLTARRQAEQALRESEARFRGTFENAAVGIAHVGLDGHWLRVNDRLCEITGYAHEELLTRTFQDITHPDDLAADLTSVRQMLTGGVATYAMEKRYIRKDGGIVWINLTVSLMRQPSGEPDYFISVVEDITLRKQAEEALREREERYELVIGGAEAAIWDWHVPAKRVVFSPRWKELRGLSAAEVSDREDEWSSRIHPDDCERVIAAVRAHFEGRTPVFAEEYRVRHKDGRWIWILDRGIARRDAAGQVIRMAGSETDITERKAAEGALRESEARLRAVIETAVDGIITIDERGQVDSINPAAVRLFGYAPREVIGRNITMLMPEPYKSEHNAYLDNYMKTGTKKIIGIGREVVGLRKDGSTFPMDLAVSETTLDNRRLFTGIVRDISQRKASEEALRIRARQQQAVAKLGELALRERELQTVFEHVVAMVAETLEVDYGKVLELLPGGEAMRLRAGVGWKEGLVGKATVSTGRDSQAGYALLSDAPVVVEDLRQEKRFSGPPLLIDHGVISGMSCIIRGTGGTPWGVLGIHSTRRLSFTQDDVNFLAAVANVLSDAIQREQAEQTLRESEERLRIAKDAAALGIHDYDATTGRIRWDARVRQLWGVGPDEPITYETFFSGLHPDDRAATQAAVDRALEPAGDGTYYAEYRVIRRADGMTQWIAATGHTTFENGQAVRLVGTMQNITGRKQAEEELRRSEARYRATFVGAPVGIAHVGLDGRFLRFNDAVCTITGYPREELERLTFSDITHPDDLETDWTQMRRMRTGEIDTYSMEKRYLRKDGNTVWVNLTVSMLRDAAGEPLQFISVIEDFTERKRLEERLRQSAKMEAIGTLAGGIAHEFNNILAGLLGFATLLHREMPPESRAGLYVQQVRQAGQRAKDLVQQIVTFSRAELTTKEPLRLDQVVHEALTLLRASLPSTIDIQCRLSEPGVMVHASRTQLHGVVMNLGANADYAMRESGGCLTVGMDPVEIDAAFAAAHPPLSPGSYIRLTMDDTGSGMTPEVMEHIFEPFFTTKAIGEGTGMGLAIVHGIVTSHGGTITVECAQGVGTRFAIYLPRIDAPAVPAATPEPPLPQGKGCVLLVDDEETVALALRLLLESLGYDAVVHTTSHDALAAFRTAAHRFDVVITDQTMPQMTGEDLIRALRRIRPDIPVILCTGFSHIMDAQKAQVLGNVTFLMKPVDEHELAVRLQQVLAPNPAKTSSVLGSA